MALSGEEIWRFQAGSYDGYDYAYGVSADADGSFFLAGQTSGSFDGVATNAGERDLIAAKIDGDGSLLWSWQDGAVGDDSLSCAAAMDDGGVVVGGYSNGTYNGVASQGLVDFLAIKLDSDGAVEWHWQEGTDTDDNINTCSKTADGNVVLTGATEADWAETGANPGFASIVAVKLDVTDGIVLWRYQTGIAAASVVSFASDARADGSIVLGGWTTGDWDGEGELVGITDFAAVALDEDGVELWRWQDGPASSVNIMHGVAALSDGSVVLVGSTEGDYASPNAGGLDFVVVKLTAAGVVDWRWQDGTLYDDEFEGVATGIDGNSVIMGGYTIGSWVETNEAEGDYMDFAGMAMDADGTSLWTYQSGTVYYNDFNNVAVRPDGAALLVGWTSDEFLETTTTNYYSDFAGVLIETGSVAASPTPSTSGPTAAPLPTTATLAPVAPPSPTPATPAPETSPQQPSASTRQPFIAPPSSCEATESFQITSDDLPEIEGCFQATDESFSNPGSTFEAWTVGGDLDFEQVAVLGNADDGTGEIEDGPYYVLFASEDDDAIVYYCQSEEDAITVHPTDATWLCDPDGTGSFVEVSDGSTSFDCGCTLTPAPAPAPAPTSAPVAVEPPTTSSTSSVPLGPVIGGSVGGLALLAIVGILVAKRRGKQKDRGVGHSRPAPVAYPAVSGGAAGGGGNGGSTFPPPPKYSEPPLPTANVAPPGGEFPPPPPYSGSL